ncbi:hypothetical protein Leryth_005707 [Lithospermum erythrorhizon]|nr:hypothetical protein Leryth_005707 [Lithospermum erythrorhizon]
MMRSVDLCGGDEKFGGLLIWGCIMRGVFSITFVMDKEECFSHKIENGAIVHYSFVVIGIWSWEKK